MQDETQNSHAPLTLTHFTVFQKRQRETAEAQEWLKHIGARGRDADILILSPAHCVLKLVVAGQYVASGKNYWDSPAAFNAALIAEIISRRSELFAAAVQRLKDAESKALTGAKAEIDAISAAIASVEA